MTVVLQSFNRYDISVKQYVSTGKTAIHVWLAAKLTTPPHPATVTSNNLCVIFLLLKIPHRIMCLAVESQNNNNVLL